jgi:ribulose-bisphosphate carboxylase large chain
MSERLRVTYELSLEPGEDADAKARDIAYEQTVELPPAATPAGIAEWVPGEIEALQAIDDGLWRAVIAFEPSLAAGELTQTLNLIFGNISLKRGIRVTAIDWPQALVRALVGPGYGIQGWRDLTGIRDRALAATALKPVGLSSAELAERAAAFARGGMDIIKDDHGLTNQVHAPFAERLKRCRDAVGDASLYLPNVTAAWPTMMARAEQARAAGCQAVLVSPMLTGLDAPRQLHDELGLMVMAHPSLTGGYLQTGHGFAAEVMLGDILRLAGADAVIYPNTGGRFGLTPQECEAINHHLREEAGLIRPAMPVPAGGIALAEAASWGHQYGPDTILLLGGSLYASADIETATRELIAAIEEQP